MSRPSAAAVVACACLFAPVVFAQCTDVDGDGFVYEFGCGTARDCNDASATTHPAASEICDGYDNDCDGLLDEVCAPACDDPGAFGRDRRVTNDVSPSNELSFVWTGSEYGVAWTDFRDGNYEIYFARLDAAGTKLGIDVRVTNDVSVSSNGSLVWTGSEYGVAWTDFRDGNYEIYFARLDAAGTKLGADVRVTHDVSVSTYGSLVWTGNEYGLAWSDYAGDSLIEIHFTRLDATGTRLGGIRVTGVEFPSWPLLVWTGGEYGVAWTDSRDGNREIYFTRMDAAGTILGPDVRVTDDTSISLGPSLVWTGGEYGLAWTDYRDGGFSEIYFARLDAVGTKLGPDARVTNDARDTDPPSMVWTGSEYGLAWYDRDFSDSGIYFARLDTGGTKLGPDVRATNSVDSEPSLVWTGSDYSVAWSDSRDGNSEIYFDVWKQCCEQPDADGDGYHTCVDCDDGAAAVFPGAPQTCDGINTDCLDAVWPAPHGDELDRDVDGLAFCGGDCNDTSPTTHPAAPEICDGYDNDCDALLDEDCTQACDDPVAFGRDLRVTNDASDSFMGSLVWTGSEYGVAWSDYRDGNYEIYFARLDAAGTKLGPDLRVTDDGSTSGVPSLVWTGSEYGVAWSDDRDDNYEIYFARLDAAWTKLGPDVRVTSDPSSSVLSSLVWTGSEYGVSWHDNRDGNYEIYFARLDAAGTKLGSDVRVTNDASVSGLPSLVWTGSEYGVVWYDGTFEIYFARLDAAGKKLGSDVRVTNDGSLSLAPSLVRTGSEYGVAWMDFRDGNLEIYFARLDAAGTKLGSDVRVTNDDSNSLAPSLVWTGSECGVAWSDSEGTYFARLDAAGTMLGPGVRVTNDAALSSSPSLVWTGSDYGLAWSDSRDGNDEIYFDVWKQCCEQPDADGDGYRTCVDCDDGSTDVHPEAAELCDGLDSDCDGALPVVEADSDGDGFKVCDGDCDDENATRHPEAVETCNAQDDDCDGLVDEDASGEDPDQDGSRNACENCPEAFNPSQSDRDQDFEGDACDLDDGMIYLLLSDSTLVEWHEETGFDSWNVYRGDLAVLRSSGVYTQGVGGLAWRACGLGLPWVSDTTPVPARSGVFYLVTGTASGIEGSLGTNSQGVERPNTNPCP